MYITVHLFIKSTTKFPAAKQNPLLPNKILCCQYKTNNTLPTSWGSMPPPFASSPFSSTTSTRLNATAGSTPGRRAMRRLWTCCWRLVMAKHRDWSKPVDCSTHEARDSVVMRIAVVLWKCVAHLSTCTGGWKKPLVPPKTAYDSTSTRARHPLVT